MNAFTDELTRHLRAVLSLRVQAPLPSDIPVELWALLADADDTGSPRLLAIGTPVPPYAQWNYEEPGAWEKLLADLEAVSGGPTAPVDETDQVVRDPRVEAILAAGRKNGTAGMLRPPLQVPDQVGPDPNRDPIPWPLPDKDGTP